MGRSRRVAGLAAVLAFASAQSAPPAGGGAPTISPAADGAEADRIGAALREGGATGVFLITRGGKRLFEGALGEAAPGRPMRIDAVFPIGSLSKSFTAAAVLRLAQTGRLRLDDPLERFFPEAPADKRAITARQLLEHTSGLPRNAFGFRDHLTREKVVAGALGAPLANPPGTKHAYSNLGYMLLAALVERASGEAFDRYLEREVIGRAGLRETGFPGPRFARRLLPVGFDRPRFGETYSGTPMQEDLRDWYQWGPGGLLSTARDLERWMAALRSGRVLDPRWAAELWRPRVAMTPDGRYSYAFGFVVQRTPIGPQIWHNGVWYSYFTEVRWFPEQNVLAIGLTNRQQDEKFDAAFQKAVGVAVGQPSPARAGA